MLLRISAGLFITIVLLISSVYLGALQSNNVAIKSPANAIQTVAASAEDPTKKLGAFVGESGDRRLFYQRTEDQHHSGMPLVAPRLYLVCDQLVNMGGDHRQFTVYSYDSNSGQLLIRHACRSRRKAEHSGITIKGNLWTYDSSFTANGKTTMIRTTNEFTDAKTEIFKVMSSDDNGATWKTMLEGKARKVGD